MRNRAKKRQIRREPMYAPTYSDNTSFLKLKTNRQSDSLATFTYDDLAKSLGYTDWVSLRTAALYNALKVVAVTFSLFSGSSTTPVRGVVNFTGGASYVNTDLLKSARVKPGKYTTTGFWVNISETSGTTGFGGLILFTFSGARIEFIEVAVRQTV